MNILQRVFGNRKTADKQSTAIAVTTEVVTQKRGMDVSGDIPEKVFVSREINGMYEYSEVEPARLDQFYRLLDGYYGAQNFLELFHCLPEIYAPIHEIASRVADATWQLRKTWNDEIDSNDLDFNRLFSKPNPYMDIRQLVYQSVVYRLVLGRHFWSINKPSALEDSYKNILSWFNLPSHNVQVKHKKVDPYTTTEVNDFINRYEVKDVRLTESQRRIFEPEQVIPFVNYSLRHPYNMNCSSSYLSGAEKAIKNLIPVYEARGVIYIKRGALGFIVSRKGDDSGTVALSKTETDQLHKDYQETYGINREKTQVGITGQPIDYVAVGMSIKDLEPFSETLADAVAIYATLRVPRHLVPSKDQGTFSNTDAQMKGFYDDVIIPLANEMAEAWTEGMGFSKVRKYIYASYDHIDVLQENKKMKAEVDKITTEVAVMQYEKGIITKNGRNAMLDVDSVPDGDVYAGGEGNKDPIAVQIGVGGMTALQAVLASTTMSDEAKETALVELFGVPPEVAAKLVIPKEDVNNNPKEEIDPITGKPKPAAAPAKA
jgi:hypothetical protein